MAQATEHAHDEGLLRLLSTVLPLKDLPQAVRSLAVAWRDTTEAAFAALIVWPTGCPAEPVWGWAAANGATVAHGTPAQVAERSGIPSRILPCFEPVWDATAETADDLWVRPLEWDGRTIGRLILDADVPHLDPQFLDERIDLTTRLVVSALNLELAATAPEAELLERLKLEALAQFAAGAAHEINNPVATIVGRAELLLQNETDSWRRDQLAQIGGQALRIRDMIADLNQFAHPPQPTFEACELDAVVGEVLDRLDVTAAGRGVHVERRLRSGMRVRADRNQLATAVAEVVRNAIEASESGMSVCVTTRQRDDGPSGRSGEVIVTDRGRGLSQQDAAHLFDPFYAGRQAGRGLGFGLCKCWRIVQAHGGSIRIRSDEETGTTATMSWPGLTSPPDSEESSG